MATSSLAILAPVAAKLLADFLVAERERTGLTTEEIFARAGRQLDENEAKLLADIERLKLQLGDEQT